MGGEFLSDEVTVEGPIVRACQAADLAAIETIYAHYVLHGTATFEEVPPGPDYWHDAPGGDSRSGPSVPGRGARR